MTDLWPGTYDTWMPRPVADHLDVAIWYMRALAMLSGCLSAAPLVLFVVYGVRSWWLLAFLPAAVISFLLAEPIRRSGLAVCEMYSDAARIARKERDS